MINLTLEGLALELKEKSLVIGKSGGRKAILQGKEYSLNQIALFLKKYSINSEEEPQLALELITKIRNLDQQNDLKKSLKLSIRQKVGNCWFRMLHGSSRNEILNKIEKKYTSFHSIEDFKQVLSPKYECWFTDVFFELQTRNEIFYSTNNLVNSSDDQVSLAKKFKRDPTIHYPKKAIEVHKSYDELIQELKKAFTGGVELVATCITASNHSECAAFDHKGNFIIVASLSGYHTIRNLSKLQATLNKAKIKDSMGHLIHFSGKYVDTGLQKGGHHCTHFSELYRYQIAKEKDLDAYKKVNGAFYEGLLQRFEDINKIDQAIKLEKMPSSSNKNDWLKKQYLFLDSWIARRWGVSENKWEEVSIKNFKSSLTWVQEYNGEPKEVSHYFLLNLFSPILNTSLDSEYDLEKFEKHPIQDEDLLGDLLSDPYILIVFEKNSQQYFMKNEEEW